VTCSPDAGLWVGLWLWLFLVAAGLCRRAGGVRLERPQRRAGRRGRGRTSFMPSSGGRWWGARKSLPGLRCTEAA